MQLRDIESLWPYSLSYVFGADLLLRIQNKKKAPNKAPF